jgi:hypothetical protein
MVGSGIRDKTFRIRNTIRNVGRRMAKTTLDGVDSAVTTWTHIFFGGDNTPAATKGRKLRFFL